VYRIWSCWSISGGRCWLSFADRRDWSVSEVFRRAEEYVAEVPELREEGGWVLPQPREMGEPKVDPDRWRDLLADDEARV